MNLRPPHCAHGPAYTQQSTTTAKASRTVEHHISKTPRVQKEPSQGPVSYGWGRKQKTVTAEIAWLTDCTSGHWVGALVRSSHPIGKQAVNS
jgi:hypothetical protein